MKPRYALFILLILLGILAFITISFSKQIVLIPTQATDGYEQHQNHVVEENFAPAAALEELHKRMINNPDEMVNCHAETHMIGHMAYLKLREAAYQYANPMCGGGYLHGVIEQALILNGLDYLDTVVHEQCKGDLVESCLHGIGHGIHELTQDVPRALSACQQITSDNTDCFDGVFMDRFDTEGAIDLQPPSLESALSLCESSPGETQTSCYFYLPRVLYGKAASAVTDLCSSSQIKTGWSACAQGSGVYFMKYLSGFDKEIAVTYCNQYRDSNLVTLCLSGVEAYERYGGVDNIRWH